MRILFVTPYLSTPPHFGSQRRLDGLMRGLARSHDVSLLSLVDPTEDIGASVRETRAYCRKLVTISNERYALTRAGKRLLQLRSLLSPRSYEGHLYRNRAFALALRELIARGSYDVVNVEFMHMAIDWPWELRQSLGRTLFVLDEHNIEYEIVRRTASTGASLDRKLYATVNWRKLRREELEAWRRFDGCTTTSPRDEALLLRDAPTARTAVVPNAVDIDFFEPRRPGVAEEPMSLLFFGMPGYHPNKDGLLHFIHDILPRLRARYPAVTLRIVGPSVPPEISACAGDGVEVTGLVDDIRPSIERAAVIIVPLRIGGGTRLKILEAMAMEKAVVSTTLGAEGIDVHDGREILIADTADDFARQVGRLLDDEAARRRMGKAARAVIERRYSWAHSVARLEQFYSELREVNGKAA